MRPPFFDVRLVCWRGLYGRESGIGNRESKGQRPRPPPGPDHPIPLHPIDHPITRSPITRFPLGASRAQLSASRPSESDGDVAALDDDRNFPTAGEANHPIELLAVVRVGEVEGRDLALW